MGGPPAHGRATHGIGVSSRISVVGGHPPFEPGGVGIPPMRDAHEWGTHCVGKFRSVGGPPAMDGARDGVGGSEC